MEDTFVQIESSYPGIKIKREYPSSNSFWEFNTELKNILISRNGIEILKISEAEIRFPWWILLFQTDKSEVNLNEVEIYWDYDFLIANKSKSSKQILKDLFSIKLPSRLKKLQTNVRIKKLLVLDRKTNIEMWSLDKFLIRNLNSLESSPFEILIPVKLGASPQSNFSLNIFGDVNFDLSPWPIRFNGLLIPSEKMEDEQIENLAFDGVGSLKWANLKFLSKFNLKLNKELIGTGTIDFFSGKTEALLNFERLPLNYLNVYRDIVANPFMPEFVSDSRGFLSFKKLSSTSLAQINSEIEFDGSFLYNSNQQSFPGKWRILFKDTRLETSFMTPKANITFFKRSSVDLLNLKILQYFEEVGFSDVDFSSFLNGAPSLSEIISPISENFFSSKFVFKNCRHKGNQINGEIIYGNVPDKKFYLISLNEASSSFKLNYEGNENKNRLQLISKDFSWPEQNNLLKPLINKSDFVLNGSIDGSWLDKIENGIWDIHLRAKNIINLEGYWADILNKSWSTFGEDVKLNPMQSWDLKINSSKIFLQKIVLESDKRLKMTGVLDINNQALSFIELTDLKNKKIKPIKKELSDFLPVRSL